MTAEWAPREQRDTFVTTLSEMVGPEEKGREIRTATKSLPHIDLGIIYDTRLVSGRMMLIMQEKGGQQAPKRKIRIELFANRFQIIPYIREGHIEDELRDHLIDIEAQEEPSYLTRGLESQSESERDGILMRIKEAYQLGEAVKIPNTKDLNDIRKGLEASSKGRAEYERWGSRKLKSFFERQFE